MKTTTVARAPANEDNEWFLPSTPRRLSNSAADGAVRRAAIITV
jgi:hypothetical protein